MDRLYRTPLRVLSGLFIAALNWSHWLSAKGARVLIDAVLAALERAQRFALRTTLSYQVLVVTLILTGLGYLVLYG